MAVEAGGSTMLDCSLDAFHTHVPPDDDSVCGGKLPNKLNEGGDC